MVLQRICIFLAGSVCVGVLPARAADACAPLGDERRASLARYVQRRHRVPEEARVRISEASEVADTCYRKLRFQATNPRFHFDLTLYLAPDQRFLLTAIQDSSTDPIADEKARLAGLRRQLEQGDHIPSFGRDDAPVTMVVFSDFQCPFCKQLAETLNRNLVDQTGNQVRVLFRHLPLGMHAWARPAAEAAACVQLQDTEAFWKVHDFLFARQAEITPDNALQKLMTHVSTLQEVQIDQIRQCVEQGGAQTRLREDLAVALANNVRAVPTLFVNGVRVDGVPQREQLLTLIREALAESTAAALVRK